MIFCVLCALCALCTAVSYAAPFAEPAALPPDERAALAREAPEAARAAARELGLQTELPAGAERIRPQDYGFLRRFRLPAMSQEAARAALWLSAALIVAALVPVIRASMWSDSRARRMEREARSGAAVPGAVALRMEQAQVEADDLARQGNFGEAMHVLLLQSIGELRLRLRIPISVSLTSREILAGLSGQSAASLPDEGRGAFADIIGRVEVSYFGRHLPGAGDYAACRRSYDALFAALRGNFS